MNKGETIYCDELCIHKQEGRIVFMSWVYEGDRWGYRELTDHELEMAIKLDAVGLLIKEGE